MKNSMEYLNGINNLGSGISVFYDTFGTLGAGSLCFAILLVPWRARDHWEVFLPRVTPRAGDL